MNLNGIECPRCGVPALDYLRSGVDSDAIMAGYEYKCTACGSPLTRNEIEEYRRTGGSTANRGNTGAFRHMA
jgi:DNA-directed RNA polymerase subunit RPC12/RpoP